MKISLYLKYEPITPSSYQISVESFDLPRTIVKDGRIIFKELEQINKDDNWAIS
ncbi:YetF domain-containing protein [Clostridium sp.]|uniref:YetF domain-containing protein n=1 Tax=Clostridium sp. TaxID=1506 RepID=UPI0039F55DC8